MGPFKLVWQWITTQCSCLSHRGTIQRGLKLYIFWVLREAAIKHTMHQWAVVTTPTTWRTNTFHCFDTSSLLSIKTARPALKGNQLWLWEIMNTVWPLKLNVFSLSWIISPVFCSVEEHTVLSVSCATCLAHLWINSNKKMLCLLLFLFSCPHLGCLRWVKKMGHVLFLNHRKWERDDRYGVRAVPWLLNILCCDEQQAKLIGVWVRMESRGVGWFLVLYYWGHPQSERKKHITHITPTTTSTAAASVLSQKWNQWRKEKRKMFGIKRQSITEKEI